MADIVFLTIFLPTIFLIGLTDWKIRMYLALGLSIVFYYYLLPEAIGFVLFYVAVNVIVGTLLNVAVKKYVRLPLLIVGIVVDVFTLAAFKYEDIFSKLIKSTVFESKFLLGIIPVGISFLTFRCISYLVDSYRDRILKMGGWLNPVYSLTYLLFIGQIISGPLTRIDEFYNNNGENEKALFRFAEGSTLFAYGMIKKILIADIIANVTEEIFLMPVQNASSAILWLGSICYSIQLYFDFSGYSDMAIGISRILGYGCAVNFNYPYMTASVSDFWRRWHVSLGRWFRDYVYFPLGGSKVGRTHMVMNLLWVWLLTGIWHGSSWNFIIWGLLYFVVIAFEKLTGIPNRLSRIGKVIYQICVLLFINFQWIIFNSSNLLQGINYIVRMLSFKGNLMDSRLTFLLEEYWIFILFGILFSTNLLESLWNKISVKVGKHGQLMLEVSRGLVIVALLATALSTIIAGDYNPFLYANF